MSKSLRIGLYTVALVGLTLVGLFAINRREEPGTVIDKVEVDGVDLTGLTRDDALLALTDLENKLATTPIRIQVGDARFDLFPAAIGFDLDEESVLDSALEARSPASIVEAVRTWFDGGDQTLLLPILGTVEEVALSAVLDGYDSVLEGSFEGGIVIEGTTPVAIYPRPGRAINRVTAGPRIAAALLERPRPDSVMLDTVERMPTLSVSAVDEALREANLLLDGPVTLTRTDPDATLVLNEQQLAQAFMTRLERTPSPHLVVSLDPAVIDGFLDPIRAGIEVPPVDARIIIDDSDNVRILPGYVGALIEARLVAQAAEQAARRATRTTVLPLQRGAKPEITAEYLTTLLPIEVISEFTTKHPCCHPRVGNIHLFADHLDGTMLLPGEVMSLNETVGMRTEERGYQPAPTIIKGEIVDTVGGGVSQFATTFYNAVFWAGLEIIEHQPHSYYFSRYPEGIEATISWPQPDLVFHNDTESVVVIKTSYTNTSITVTFFGDNSDREVSARVSDRFDPTEFSTVYFPNPELSPWEEELETQKGADGWSVKVTRDLFFNDGSTTTQEWTVRYRPWPRHAEVHPCLLPEDSEDYTGEECPPEPPPPVDGPTTSLPDSGEEPSTTTTGV